ncbi:MAG: hypothetical protein H6817_11010 [Phycisphaerales bacterium]|nr:hypothetical protein [Phycisphaerales bacterium]
MTRAADAFLKTMVVVILIAGTACETPIDDGDGDTLVDVHKFQYDPTADEYVVNGERVASAKVKQDLAGNVCSKCHTEELADLKNSVHYRWAARNDNVLFPGGGAHGMIDRACGLPASSSLINFVSDVQLDECGKCHVGRYIPMVEQMLTGSLTQMGLPDAAEQAARIVDGGIDCLICHAEEYRSYPADGNAQVAGFAPADGHSPTPEGYARVARDDTDFDGDGEPDALIDTDGDGIADMPLMMDRDGDGTPETPWPTIAQDRSLASMSSIGETNDHACLRCHEHARTGYKRGTLFRPGHDVHASSAAVETLGGGTDRHCVACHTSAHHKFKRGDLVGGDLMAVDYAVGSEENELTCLSCHETAQLNPVYHTEKHLAAMACETCHIPATSGITYALWGHGTNLTFGRNADGLDTLVISSDHFLDGGTDEDVNSDWEAYRAEPTLTWFNGQVSFLAQPLSLRGSPNAKITPFKPMANGMVFDARFFNGMMANNDAMDGAYQYNANTMYRFMAGGSNADIFAALDFLDLTPEETRQVTLNDFMSENPDRQAMALMQIFPNMILFDKSTYGYVRYTVASNSPWDANADGFIDAGQPFYFDMLASANNGLRAFQGFNAAMGLPADYEWYPQFESASDIVSMKVPDGTLIKMFLTMQAAQLPAEDQPAFMQMVANYPAFSNGITLGGHGVRPKEEAVGAGMQCGSCHASGGLMDHKVPVTQTVSREVAGFGTFEFPVYRWRYYNFHKLVDLGLATEDADVVAGTADVDIAGDTTYVRESVSTIVVNYMDPAGEGSYYAADDDEALSGTDLTADDLSINGGSWMPALEPVVNTVPNYQVLGYARDEILFMD